MPSIIKKMSKYFFDIGLIAFSIGLFVHLLDLILVWFMSWDMGGRPLTSGVNSMIIGAGLMIASVGIDYHYNVKGGHE
ncbi:MAG: hypothetical protein ABXS91_08635 [Sulfurimonas sp.]